MPLTVPTLEQIIADAETEITSYTQEDAHIPFSVGWILARVIAPPVRAVYKLAQWASKQIFVDQADNEGVLRHAGIYNVPRLQGDKATSSSVEFHGVNGTVVPNGTEFSRGDGELYETTAVATCNLAGADPAYKYCYPPARAKVRGKDGNCAIGTKFELVSVVVGLATAISNTVAFAGGNDLEAIKPDLRDRVLEKLREPKQGGAVSDYKQWVREALTNIDAVLVLPWGTTGAVPGAVDVYFTVDNGAIPSAGQRTTVLDYINADGRRPATANVTVPALVADNWTITIQLVALAGYDIPTVRLAVIASVAAMFRAEFIRQGKAGTIKRSHLANAIADALGEDWHIIVSIDPGAVVDITWIAGHIPIANAFAWT